MTPHPTPEEVERFVAETELLDWDYAMEDGGLEIWLAMDEQYDAEEENPFADPSPESEEEPASLEEEGPEDAGWRQTDFL